MVNPPPDSGQSDPSPITTRRLAFEAGRLAASRDLIDTVLVPALSVESQSPEGAPLIVLCGPGELTGEVARAVAALIGAGRRILVVAADADTSAAAWIPTDALYVIGAPLPAKGPSAPPSAVPALTSPKAGLAEESRVERRSPRFWNLRLFADVQPDPIGHAAQQWNLVRHNLAWPLDEVPLPAEGAYAWFGSWPLEPSGPAVQIR